MADTYLVERFDPDRLRALRKQRGLSQEKLAGLLGLARGQVVAYENSRTTPRAKAMFAIAQVLDVEVTELLRPGPVDMPILRLGRNLSQADVADALGVSRPWYQRIEARQARIEVGLLRKLSDVLKVDEDTLAKLLRVR